MAIGFNESPFETLPNALRRRIENLLKPRIYKKGENTYVRGEPSEGLLWQRSGVALSYRKTPDDSYEFAVPVYRGMWTAPSIVNGAHTATQQAITDCEFSVITRAEVAELEDEPEFMELIAHWCAEDFSLMFAATAAMNQTRSDEKLLAYFRQVMKLTRNDPDADPTTMTGEIPWPFTIVQVAEYTNVSRPHVSTVLSKMTADGRLKIEHGRLTLYP